MAWPSEKKPWIPAALQQQQQRSAMNELSHITARSSLEAEMLAEFGYSLPALDSTF